MSPSRKPFPQFNPFRDYVFEELRRRKNTTSPTAIAAPFLRLSSCMEDADKDYAFFSLGLHGFDRSGGRDIFDLTYGMGREVVGYGYTRSKNSAGRHNKKLIFADDISADVDKFREVGNVSNVEELVNARQTEQLAKVVPEAAHPIPGITNVSVIRRGLGQPLLATVNWQCYNQGQLEFLRNHFLSTGNYVILEFGNQFSDKFVTSTLDFQSDHGSTFDVLRQCIGATGQPGLLTQGGRQFVINNYNEPNNGNYDFIVGQVGNFEVNIDPVTGIYKCTTKIVSQGENVWGISINNTFVTSDESSNTSEITSIKEYFELGRYWEFIGQTLGNPAADGIFKSLGTQWSAGQTSESTKDAAGVEQNPNDYVFVTWNFMMKELFHDMIAVIKNQAVRDELNHYAQFGSILEDDYIGYHPELLSTEPEVMILLNKTISSTIEGSKTLASELNAAGQFTPIPNVADGRAGKINEGVLLNTGMIRECFMGAHDLRQAISSVLSRMNHAVGGYWQLQLFWDDELATYRIIDYKFGSQHRNEKFYRFNVGGAGECLDIEFDSAFPPELITQMNLVSMYQTLKPTKQNEYLNRYPLLGTTSAHMFMLNWTHLQDGLRQRVELWRSGLAGNTPSPSQEAIDATDRLNSLSTFTRITNSTGGTRNTPSVLGNASTGAGEKLNTPKAVSSTVDNQTITPTRNSVKSIGSIRPSALQQLNTRIPPLGMPIVTSPFAPAGRTDAVSVGRKGKPHLGVDYRAAVGTPIVSTMDGMVYSATYSNIGSGNTISINHGNGIQTSYSHLSKFHPTLLDANGNFKGAVQVRRGDIIGYSGNTGVSTAPHLHYKIVVDGRAVNPENPGENITPATQPNFNANNASLPPGAPLTPPSQQPTDIVQSTTLKNNGIELRRAEVTKKFGDELLNLIAQHRGDMINKITKDGYSNSTTPNQFVAPFPTTTSITVEIQGLAGISISDGFFVDKIPFLFEKHGVFQVTEVIDIVTPNGWRTKIKGYFKMLWYDGNGRSNKVF
jgi:murein DD-endopeptidase MepM/ murein hydrolase activator NlpD